MHENNNKVKLYNSQEDLENVIVLAGSFPIWINVQGTLGTEIERYISNSNDKMMVCSDNKEIIQELFISYPNITYGLVEPKNRYLELSQKDYFVSFVILNFVNFENSDHHKFLFWREKHPNVRIYARGVLKPDHVRLCRFWNVDGIIADKPQMVQDNLKKFTKRQNF